MNSAIQNSLHRGQVLATTTTSSRASHLAWVGVYPLDPTRESTRELLTRHGQPLPTSAVHVYRIRKFEVDRKLIEQDASIAEPELENKETYFVYGEQDLEEKLRQLGVDIGQLHLPYKSNYPI